jgi:hypothetical protein
MFPGRPYKYLLLGLTILGLNCTESKLRVSGTTSPRSFAPGKRRGGAIGMRARSFPGIPREFHCILFASEPEFLPPLPLCATTIVAQFRPCGLSEKSGGNLFA